MRLVEHLRGGGRGDARGAVEAGGLAEQAVERHGGVGGADHGDDDPGAPQRHGAVPATEIPSLCLLRHRLRLDSVRLFRSYSGLFSTLPPSRTSVAT